MTCVRLILIWLVGLHATAEDALQRIGVQSSDKVHAIALSSSGKFVAIENSRGGIWLGEAAMSLGKQITKEGTGSVAFAWSPDEKYVWIARAGKASVFAMAGSHLEGALVGRSPLSLLEVSPDSRHTAFIRDNNLWLVTGPKQRALTQLGGDNLLIGVPDQLYGREFDVVQHYWWSPDSSSIAFIETQFRDSDHYVIAGAKLPAFRLKTVDIRTGQVRTISETSVEWPYLLRPVWHPDSKRIAFYRMNRLQNLAELCLFDNNGIRVVESEKDSYWVNAPETPLFVGEGSQIVVSSERSGHRHVYLYRLDGKLLKDLTPDDLEVYRLHASTDPAGGVFVSGSLGTRQEQQLFRLDLAGGAPRQVTVEPGWHDVSLSASGNAYLDTFSSAIQPPVTMWHREEAVREVVPREVNEKALEGEFLDIQTHDGIGLPARLFKPDDFDKTKRCPLIIYTFSGPRGRVVADRWGGWQMAWNRYMVSKGYLILTVDVRGSGGYGHLFEEYIHYRFGAQETADLREVVSYLRRQSYVDGSRLGIWGCDYGAHTVVHAMLQFPGGFKAGFADSPITEWSSYNAYFTERYLGLPPKRITEYDDSTALEDAQRMTGTLMVVSSDKNPFIRDEQVKALQKAFAGVKRNKEVIRRLRVDGFADADYREKSQDLAELMRRMTVFFSEAL